MLCLYFSDKFTIQQIKFEQGEILSKVISSIILKRENSNANLTTFPLFIVAVAVLQVIWAKMQILDMIIFADPYLLMTLKCVARS